MSEKVAFKIKGEWLTNFIRSLYYSEDKCYDECKEKLLKSLCVQELGEDEREELSQGIIFGDKKLVGTNSLELIDDLDFDAYDYSRISRPKKFAVNRGITGILMRDGIFAECNYGQHDKTIDFLNSKYNKCSGAVIFSTIGETGIGENGSSYAYMDTEDTILSKQQVKWFMKNEVYLTRKQRILFKSYINKVEKGS